MEAEELPQSERRNGQGIPPTLRGCTGKCSYLHNVPQVRHDVQEFFASTLLFLFTPWKRRKVGAAKRANPTDGFLNMRISMSRVQVKVVPRVHHGDFRLVTPTVLDAKSPTYCFFSWLRPCYTATFRIKPCAKSQPSLAIPHWVLLALGRSEVAVREAFRWRGTFLLGTCVHPSDMAILVFTMIRRRPLLVHHHELLRSQGYE